MRKRPLRYLFMAMATATVAASAYLGQGISWEHQEPVYSALFQVSAIVFGVMGAWIAIVHPKTLGEILSRQGQETEQSRRARKLLDAMKWATTIVAASLLVQLFAPLAKEVDILRAYKAFVRGASMAFVALLVVTQLWTLLLSLLPIDDAEGEIKRAVGSAESRNRRIAGTAKQSEEVKPPDGDQAKQ